MKNKFSKILNDGGLGYKYEISTDVIMKNEQRFNLSFIVNAINEKKALDEAIKVLKDADYIIEVKSINNPKKLS